jgi:hypothetical protein
VPISRPVRRTVPASFARPLHRLTRNHGSAATWALSSAGAHEATLNATPDGEGRWSHGRLRPRRNRHHPRAPAPVAPCGLRCPAPDTASRPDPQAPASARPGDCLRRSNDDASNDCVGDVRITPVAGAPRSLRPRERAPANPKNAWKHSCAQVGTALVVASRA